MPDASNPDVIYIPDPPGLMKTGGLNPIAVTLPLELGSRIRGWSLYVAALTVVLAVVMTRSAFPAPLKVIALCVIGPLLWSVLLTFASHFLQRGPTLRIDSEGLTYRRLNKSVCSFAWTDVVEAQSGAVATIYGYAGRSDAILVVLSHPVPGRRYAFRLSAILGRPNPWPTRLAQNVVAFPVDNLSMPPSTVETIVEEVLRRNGRPFTKWSS